MLKPYSPNDSDGVKCPVARPASVGLHLPIRQIVRGLSGDLWRVNVSGDVEITISLIDCFAPPLYDPVDDDATTLKINERGRRCYDVAWNLFEKSSRQLSVLIPVPAVDRGWLRSLNADAQLPGWIWVTDRHTINAWLVARGLADVSPSQYVDTRSAQQRRDRAA